MQIELSGQELEILKKISAAAKKLGIEAYLIGGHVRDKLIGRSTNDLDIVCLGDGIELAHAVASLLNPKPIVNYFKNFGTAQIKWQPLAEKETSKKNLAEPLEKLEIEFVGARKESYQQHSRKPEVCPGTIEDDQNRRDFTINALAISLNEANFGQLIDPFGGMDHLKAKLLKTPLDPAITFNDDPLRMLRAIRFAAQLQFTIEEATLLAIKNECQRIRIISMERITDELNKIILSQTPSIGFKLLFDTGLLQLIFPQMAALAGAENIEGIGHKDNFSHTLQVLNNISNNTQDLWLRWAAILHDIGKPITKKFEPGHGWTFHGHENLGGRMVPKIFDRLKLPMHDKMRYVKKLVELHHRPISVTQENITDSAIRRLLFDAGEEFDDLMTLCNADITSKNKAKVKRYMANFDLVKKRCAELEEKDRIRNWQPPITGEIIMKTFGLNPGRQVGIIKNALREAMLDGLVENNFEAAYQYMLLEGAKLNLHP